MGRKDKHELFVCVICDEEVERIKSWQYEDGRACRIHSEAREAREAAKAQPTLQQHRSPAAEEISDADLVHRASVVKLMKGSTTAEAWDTNCTRVRRAHGGEYPDFWGEAIVTSGIMSAALHGVEFV